MLIIIIFSLLMLTMVSCSGISSETESQLSSNVPITDANLIHIPLTMYNVNAGSKDIVFTLTHEDDVMVKISSFCVEHLLDHNGCRTLRKEVENRLLKNINVIEVNSKYNSTVKFQKVFQTVYDTCYWESYYGSQIKEEDAEGKCSGLGSTLNATKELKVFLLSLFIQYNITSLLDAPCGAMAWIPTLLDVIVNQPDIFPQFHYTGIDVVPSVIAKSKQEFQHKSNWSFYNIDMTSWKSWETQMSLNNNINNRLDGFHDTESSSDGKIYSPPYQYDLIMAKDVFFHLTYDYIKCSINNFKRTNSTWLLATSHNLQQNKSESDSESESMSTNMNINNGNDINSNRDLVDGEMFGNIIDFRPIDLTLFPFEFPQPIEGTLINTLLFYLFVLLLLLL